jgi:hypothetical protein
VRTLLAADVDVLREMLTIFGDALEDAMTYCGSPAGTAYLREEPPRRFVDDGNAATFLG